MAKTISASVKQALTSRGFFAAAAAVAVLLLLSSGRELIETLRKTGLPGAGFHRRLILGALRSEAMTMALPIAAALPFATSVVDECKSGFIKEYLSRTSSRAYIAGRAAACVLSGGAGVCLGICLAGGLAALALSPWEGAGAGPADGRWELLRCLPLFFLSGGFWAMIGMLLATLTGSRTAAYASPFILCYVLIILYERYFADWYVFYPKEWVAPSPSWRLGGLGAMAVVSALTVVAALCFYRAAKRRLAQI